MKLSLIVSSHRKTSNSMKSAQYFEGVLKEKGHEATLADLNHINLPFWDEEVWEKGRDWHKEWNKLAQTLEESEAFVFFVPEYGGMVPARLKNLFLLCSAKELGHKPALITTVSSGIGGAYPVSELRMSGYKNNKVNFIPDHLILRNADKLFGAGPDERETRLRERIDKTLDLLLVYGKAFQSIRESQSVKDFSYNNGM